MFKYVCLCLSFFNCNYSSHANHWDSETDEKTYNEQRRESLPASSLIHNASTSIITTRLDRGAVDLPGVPRVTSDDSPDKIALDVNVATTVDVKAKCCNSNCCDDDKVFCNCC